jgi:2,4-dienoyl-CoA reductase-like NADH-dependent reductase (Old Yellow Enzyme family)
MLLAQHIRISSLELRNRLVKASLVENMATEDGAVTDRLIRFYERHARGGAGLLITGGAYVQASGRSVRYLIGAHDDRLVAGLSRLTRAVHDLDGRIALQIYHAGRQTRPDLVGGDVIAPSAVKDTLTGVQPRAMSEAEIEAAIFAFGRAAERAAAAGFDAVEVMAGHGYLINQFLSGRTNRREDGWGGSLENRARFLFGVLKEIRSRVGPDFPLLVKINTEDQLKNGFTLEECAWVAERLPALGVDAVTFTGGTFESGLNISRGDIPAEEILEEMHGWQKFRSRLIIRAMRKKFEYREAYFLENVQKIKPHLSVPVILVGGLRTPAVMERILENGQADLIALGRPIIREPNFPRRVLAGDPTPAACLNCNRCFIRITQERPLRCYALKSAADEEEES